MIISAVFLLATVTFNMQFNPFAMALVVSILITGTLAVLTYKSRQDATGLLYSLTMACVCFWSLAYALELSCSNIDAMLFFIKIEYLAIPFVAPLWFLFVQSYIGNYGFLKPKKIIFLLLLPIITVFMVLTADHHNLYYSNVATATVAGCEVLDLSFGLFYWLHIIYLYILVLSGIGFLIKTVRRHHLAYKKQAKMIILAGMIPIVFSAIYLAGMIPIEHIDPSPFAFTFTGLISWFAVFELKILEFLPIARDYIFNSMPDGVIVIGRDLKLADCNFKAAKIFGWEKIPIGQKVDILLQELPQMLEKCHLDSEEVFEVTIDNGSQKALYEVVPSKVVSHRGHIASKQFLMRDVTEHKRIQKELSKRVEFENLLVNLSLKFINIPIIHLGDAINEGLELIGRFVDADRAYVFDYDFELGIMKNTFEWCAEGVKPEINNLQAVPNALSPDWVDSHKKGKPMFINDVSALEEGNLKAFLEPQEIKSLITIPLNNESECIGFIGFDAVWHRRIWSNADIELLHVFSELLVNAELRRRYEIGLKVVNTKLRTAVQKSDKLAQEARNANIAKSQFLANMSHEIRTPMNGVIGMTELLLQTELSGKQRQYAEIVHSCGESMLSLISDILDFSKIEAGKMEMDKVDFDLKAILERVREVLQASIDKKGLKFSCNISDDVVLRLSGDSLRLRQILLNLAGNAVKFTDAGLVSINVSTVAVAGNRIKLKFEVSDTGIGIPKEQQKSLFTAFEQLDKSNTRKFGGSGLGLAISKKFVELMDGEINVESEQGKGSLFWFTAVFDRGLGQAEHRQGDLSVRNRKLPESCRILVAEDNPINRKVADGILEQLNLNADIVDDGLAAIEMLKKGDYDLVLMDVQMPVMDGITATQKVRRGAAGEKNRSIPIVAMTANAMKGDREKYIEAGMDDYISKPIKAQLLLEILTKILSTYPR